MLQTFPPRMSASRKILDLNQAVRSSLQIINVMPRNKIIRNKIIRNKIYPEKCLFSLQFSKPKKGTSLQKSKGLIFITRFYVHRSP